MRRGPGVKGAGKGVCTGGAARFGGPKSAGSQRPGPAGAHAAREGRDHAGKRAARGRGRPTAAYGSPARAAGLPRTRRARAAGRPPMATAPRPRGRPARPRRADPVRGVPSGPARAAGAAPCGRRLGARGGQRSRPDRESGRGEEPMQRARTSGMRPPPWRPHGGGGGAGSAGGQRPRAGCGGPHDWGPVWQLHTRSPRARRGGVGRPARALQQARVRSAPHAAGGPPVTVAGSPARGEQFLRASGRIGCGRAFATARQARAFVYASRGAREGGRGPRGAARRALAAGGRRPGTSERKGGREAGRAAQGLPPSGRRRGCSGPHRGEGGRAGAGASKGCVEPWGRPAEDPGPRAAG
jgi:hypothetical protein